MRKGHGNKPANETVISQRNVLFGLSLPTRVNDEAHDENLLNINDKKVTPMEPGTNYLNSRRIHSCQNA